MKITTVFQINRNCYAKLRGLTEHGIRLPFSIYFDFCNLPVRSLFYYHITKTISQT